jgi:hypothetical protein
MSLRPGLAVVLTLSACSDTNFSKIPEANGGDGPRIEVSPGLLQFGTLGHDDPAAVQTFTIKSVGDVDLRVDEILIDGEAMGSFTLLTEGTEFLLPPGATQEIEVAFLPLGANDQFATAQVYSDDPEKLMAPVELVGAGAVPELQITPDPLDIGSEYVGCDEVDVITLTNVGTDTLIVDSVAFDADPTLSLVPDYLVPITLEPGESSWLNVAFAPQEAVAYGAVLTLTSNEPMGERAADLTATGRYAGEYTDIWEIPEDPPTDILFAIDQSCSMDDDSSRLGANFSTFIGLLGGYSSDWQVGIANDDDGCLDTGILTPAVSGYATIFNDQVTRGGGTWTEALLTVARNAAQEGSYAGGCNYGFMRPEAALHVVLVSDEAEQSWETWSSLVTQIQAAKGDPGKVKISAIAGDYPGGCASADAGDGYYQAVTSTGGEFLSICSDWASSTNLERLASASVFQTSFELQHTPIPSTIEVEVNGAVTTDWVYDPATNTVSLTVLRPEGGDTVEISYGGQATCD